MLNTALYERTQILIGDAGIKRLQQCNIFLAGVGGVGGHCAEALVRAGVGRITLVDNDVVAATNKNRQLIALDSNIGQSKVEALARRLHDVNAACHIVAMERLITAEDAADLLRRQRYDCVVDCIDTVECKTALLCAAIEQQIRVFSSCGAGGRLDPLQVTIGDLFDTENDGLARACRQALRQRGVGPGTVTVVHSREKGLPPLEPQRQEAGGRDRALNGTISYMPPLFGLLLSSAVIRCALDPKKWDEEKQRALRKIKKMEKKSAKKRAKVEKTASE
ncbi:ubiquitin-activating enzyme [Strigomonas culicis]|uniref:Ubiquitin-activating enzyme n=1 Tax=Strigomonas culicis TaxID=28005 RepID=S9UQM4_9TRYP|nr:ubiquitin-activating enzyme [Strigomonas culicis]|eukprot:EPY31158.1 ubiquitin-activating enzyme [Strigomonas culicis]